MKIAIEILLLIIILMCTWNGYKKGLVMCIGTILAIIISLYVGDLLSDTFSPAVKPVLRPFVGGYMDGSDGVISNNLKDLLDGNKAGLSVDDALKQYPEIKSQLIENSYKDVGIFTPSAKKMATEAVDLAETNSLPVTSATVDVLCGSVTYFFGFIIFFVITMIVLTVLGNILNLSFKIPEKEKLNYIGGAVAGAITGIMFCMIITWILKFSGALFPEEEMRRTLLTALFLKMDVMSVFLTI